MLFKWQINIKRSAKDSYLNQIIVMPSVNFLAEGSDILVETPLSPFLKESNIEEFEVLEVEKSEIFNFGKVKDIIKFNNEFNSDFNDFENAINNIDINNDLNDN